MKICNADAGLWLSRENGWHNAYLVVDLAEDWGMTIADDEAAILRAYRRDQAVNDGGCEEIQKAVNGDEGLTARATAYLQSLVKGGGTFVWVDNSLWLRKGASATR